MTYVPSNICNNRNSNDWNKLLVSVMSVIQYYLSHQWISDFNKSLLPVILARSGNHEHQ